jgi:Flp pilus assembly pilin Flp
MIHQDSVALGREFKSKEGNKMLQNLALRVFAVLQALESKVTDEEGQTLAEYGLIMAVIAVAVIVAAAVAFKDGIISAFNSATACLSGSC